MTSGEITTMANNEKVKPIGGPPSDVEHIKQESNYLRGALVETLSNPITGGLPEDDNRSAEISRKLYAGRSGFTQRA